MAGRACMALPAPTGCALAMRAGRSTARAPFAAVRVHGRMTDAQDAQRRGPGTSGRLDVVVNDLDPRPALAPGGRSIPVRHAT